jgi:cobalt/nickel transport protein
MEDENHSYIIARCEIMDKTTRNIIIILAVLIILTPLGLVASGETFGEWSLQGLKDKIGHVPSGMSGLSNLWNAPMADYGIPGIGDTTAGAVIGYLISAIVGVLICVGAVYLLGRLMARNDD